LAKLFQCGGCLLAQCVIGRARGCVRELHHSKQLRLGPSEILAALPEEEAQIEVRADMAGLDFES